MGTGTLLPSPRLRSDRQDQGFVHAAGHDDQLGYFCEIRSFYALVHMEIIFLSSRLYRGVMREEVEIF